MKRFLNNNTINQTEKYYPIVKNSEIKEYLIIRLYPTMKRLQNNDNVSQTRIDLSQTQAFPKREDCLPNYD